MNKYIDAAATSNSLSLVAMEEASRVGQRTADIDHLLLALSLNGQSAGQALRSVGITLDAAREAVAAHHAEHLATLGIQTPEPGPGRIVFHETNGYEWSDRALSILKRASEKGKRGDASAVLRELVEEPSGTIEAILRHFGTTPKAVVAKLDAVERQPSKQRQHSERSDALTCTTEVFVPASPEQVWELLTDPSRAPEWDPSIGSVEQTRTSVDVGDTWSARSRTKRADGRPITVKPEVMTQHVEVVALEASRLIEWHMTFPDTPHANRRHLRIELEPAEGGAQLLLSLSWERISIRGRRPFIAFALRPLARLFLRMLLSQLASSISRAFR